MRGLILIKVSKHLRKCANVLIQLNNTLLQGLDFLNLSFVLQLVVKIVDRNFIFHVQPEVFHFCVVVIQPSDWDLHGYGDISEA